MSENNTILTGDETLEEKIQKNGALYFFRATPFTEHGEYNYNGTLKEKFFFNNLFTEKGNCSFFCDEIIKAIIEKHKKSIVLIGNQGCGKTTFVHHLKRKINDKRRFEILDFDKNTSNPNLDDYIEIFSSYLFNKIDDDLKNNSSVINKIFYNLYICNENLILKKINGANNIRNFFNEFHEIFIEHNYKKNTPDNFKNNIDALFFNQILCLVVLWKIAEFQSKGAIEPIVFCLDNLDVLVNNDIINGFFQEYFNFTRNIDSIIQKLHNPYIGNKKIEYNNIFTFVFSCRQHTWAKVKKSYIHQGNIIAISTFEKDITDAFDKNEILNQRELYIKQNENIYNEFTNHISNVKSLLEDMKEWHNIYDLFNGDYRQCSITFEILLEENPNLLNEYIELKGKLLANNLYGARGLIYKKLFDKFKGDNLFELIGVLPIDSNEPPVSDARIILDYLDYYTFSLNQNKSVTFEKMVQDFEGIVDRDRLNYSIIQMFKLGVENSLWNELVAFVQIDNDELENCTGTKIFITNAGHEYLDLIATHFEFFNTRVVDNRINNIALFSNISNCRYTGTENYSYNFEETIQNVINIVNNCCKKMSDFYETIMFKKFKSKDKYLSSEFVYKSGKTNVFHGERIIHTHIRYIDHYRRFLLNNKEVTEENNKINKTLVDFIKTYIEIGNNNPNILSSKSTDELFPRFNSKIEIIESSGYTNYTIQIN